VLTKAQLKKIEEAIKRRFLVFTYEALGEEALSEEEINQLKKLGLLRTGTRHFIGDAYTLGRISTLVKHARLKDITFAEAMDVAKTLKPMTGVEKQAIKWSSTHAGQYVRGIGDDISKELGAATSRVALSALREVREGVSSAIRDRSTTSELRSTLYHAIKVKHKDWQRVASTEMHEAIQRGVYSEVRRVHGDSQLVYKQPSPSACAHCRRVFLKSDGTPRVFKLSELEDNNFGKKAADWGPVIGAVHPWCQCQLLVIPDGYDFVKDPKTGKARLEYTGETAAPSTEKSFHSDREAEEDECICGY
jgi:hypothetical protein